MIAIISKKYRELLNKMHNFHLMQHIYVMLRSRAIFLKLEWRLLRTISYTSSMFPSVEEVEDRTERSMSSTISRPSLNAFNR